MKIRFNHWGRVHLATSLLEDAQQSCSISDSPGGIPAAAALPDANFSDSQGVTIADG